MVFLKKSKTLVLPKFLGNLFYDLNGDFWDYFWGYKSSSNVFSMHLGVMSISNVTWKLCQIRRLEKIIWLGSHPSKLASKLPVCTICSQKFKKQFTIYKCMYFKSRMHNINEKYFNKISQGARWLQFNIFLHSFKQKQQILVNTYLFPMWFSSKYLSYCLNERPLHKVLCTVIQYGITRIYSHTLDCTAHNTHWTIIIF